MAPIRYISCCPGCVDRKTRRCPSGDQRAPPAMVASSEVNGRALEPSASQIQISFAPVRFELKEIRRPSGE